MELEDASKKINIDVAVDQNLAKLSPNDPDEEPSHYTDESFQQKIFDTKFMDQQ